MIVFTIHLQKQHSRCFSKCNSSWDAMCETIVLVLAVSLALSGLTAAQPVDNSSNKTRIIPPYVRGEGQYKFFLEDLELDRGLRTRGTLQRLRLKLDGLVNRKQPIKVAAIGGSITAGQGCVDAPNWPQVVFNYLEDHFPNLTTGHLGAVAGTLSTYMSVCHNVHVPKDTDIIFVEYSVNDIEAPLPAYKNEMRKSFERLLRKLLTYPNKPAIVLVHSYQWLKAGHTGVYWSNAEREFGELALYYDLPELSVKGCCYHQMAEGIEGFLVHTYRLTNVTELKGKVFYYDMAHPDGQTGARAMAEMAIHLLVSTIESLKAKPMTPEGIQWAQKDYTHPMIPGNLESIVDRCFIGEHFKNTVVSKDGWEWINESKTTRPKWGFISSTPGKTLKMKVDTRAKAMADTEKVVIELAYLASYEHMGSALVKCESGCACEEKILRGHSKERNSQLHLFNFLVTQSLECVISVTVREETVTGEHKVKLAGIIISETGDVAYGVKNYLAVEYVHDISMRKDTGVFDIRNHA